MSLCRSLYFPTRWTFLLASVAWIGSSAAAESLYVGIAGGVPRADGGALIEHYGQDAAYVPGRNFFYRSVRSSRYEDPNSAWKLFAGWKASRYLSVEVSYSDYGAQVLEYTGSRNSCCGRPFFDPLETRLGRRSVHANAFDLLGTYPIGSFEVLAGVGVARVKTKLEADYTAVNPVGTTRALLSVSDRSVAMRFQLGVQWNVSSTWALRASAEHVNGTGSRFNVDGTDGEHTGRSRLQTAWLGLHRTF